MSETLPLATEEGAILYLPQGAVARAQFIDKLSPANPTDDAKITVVIGGVAYNTTWGALKSANLDAVPEVALAAIAGDVQAVETARQQVEGNASSAAESEAVALGAADLARDDRRAAEDAAGTAVTQADFAAGQATDAAGAAMRADQAATSAGVSAAAAAAGSTLYPSVAAGLAGTAEGSTFGVQGSGATFAAYYRKSAGLAEAIGELPSRAAVDAVPVRSEAIRPALVVADALGDIGLTLSGDGRTLTVSGVALEALLSGALALRSSDGGSLSLNATGLELGTAGIVTGSQGAAFAVTDALGELAMWLSPDATRFSVAGWQLRAGIEGRSELRTADNRLLASSTVDGGICLHAPSGASLLQVTQAGVDVAGVRLEPNTLDGIALVIADELGDIAGILRSDGTWVSSGSSPVADWSGAETAESQAYAAAYSAGLLAQAPPLIQRLSTALCALIGLGQSLEEGYQSGPAIQTTPGRTLMLGGAPQSLSDTANAWNPVGGSATLQPARSRMLDEAGTVLEDTTNNPIRGEAPLTTAAMALDRRLVGDWSFGGGVLSELVVNTVSTGGRTIEELSSGTGLFGRINSYLSKLKSAADNAGKSLSVLVADFDQGQYNYRPAEGGTQDKDALKVLYGQYVDDVWAAIQAVTGQSHRPMFFISQAGGQYTATTNPVRVAVGQAQLELARERPDHVTLVGPTYQVTDVGGHLSGNGSVWVGHYRAKAMYQVFGLKRRWMPVSPIRLRWRGKTGRVDFHAPVAPLRWAKPYVNAAAPYEPADHGLLLRDNNGVLPIAALQWVGPQTLEIVGARAPSGPVWLDYAGAVQIGHGGICDSDPSTADQPFQWTVDGKFRPSENIPALVGKPYPLANWCVAFSEPFLVLN